MPGALSKLADPAAVRRTVRRRVFEAALGRVPLVHVDGVERLGTDYGGWNVPVDIIGAHWTVYSVGAGHDVSFDVEVLRRTGARVRSFDVMQRHLDDALTQADHHPHYSVHLAGVGTADAPLRLPGSADQATGGAAAGHKEWFEVDGRSVASLARELGDERIDLLKMDVEGGEYELMDTLDFDALGVQMFGVELHPTVSPRAARRRVERVRAAGFHLVSRHGGDLVFLRRELTRQ